MMEAEVSRPGAGPEVPVAMAEAPRWRRRFGAMTTINVLLLSLIAYWFANNNADADLWGHLKYGEDLLRSGTVPRTDPYSYTAGGLPWINHEVLAEVALALLFRAGAGAVVAWKLSMGLATVLAAFWLSRDHDRSPLAWLLLASLVQNALALGWAPRPQIFSYFFFAVLLVILHLGERRPGTLWFAIPWIALWTNLHGGFLFGLAWFGLYLVTKIVVEVLENRLADRGRLANWVLLGLVAVAATLINPYGIGLYEGLFRELGIQRTQVREWAAINWMTGEWMLLKILILCTLGSLIFSRKPMSLYQRVLLAAALVETQLHVRHVVFLAIAVLAWLPEHLDDTWNRAFARIVPYLTRWTRPGPAPGWLLALAAAAVVAMLGATATRFRAIRVERDDWPVEVFGYLARHGMKGKIVVPFNWAQYAIFAFYPDLRVSFDGRYGTVYSNEILDMNFDLIYPLDPRFRYRSPQSPPFDPTRVLSYGEPNLVLVNCGDGIGFPQSCEVMEEADDWVLLYQDPIARLYGLVSIYGSPDSPHFIPEAERLRTSGSLGGWVPFPAEPEDDSKHG